MTSAPAQTATSSEPSTSPVGTNSRPCRRSSTSASTFVGVLVVQHDIVRDAADQAGVGQGRADRPGPDDRDLVPAQRRRSSCRSPYPRDGRPAPPVRRAEQLGRQPRVRRSPTAPPTCVWVTYRARARPGAAEVRGARVGARAGRRATGRPAAQVRADQRAAPRRSAPRRARHRRSAPHQVRATQPRPDPAPASRARSLVALQRGVRPAPRHGRSRPAPGSLGRVRASARASIRRGSAPAPRRRWRRTGRPARRYQSSSCRCRTIGKTCDHPAHPVVGAPVRRPRSSPAPRAAPPPKQSYAAHPGKPDGRRRSWIAHRKSAARCGQARRRACRSRSRPMRAAAGRRSRARRSCRNPRAADRSPRPDHRILRADRGASGPCTMTGPCDVATHATATTPAPAGSRWSETTGIAGFPLCVTICRPYGSVMSGTLPGSSAGGHPTVRRTMRWARAPRTAAEGPMDGTVTSSSPGWCG